MSQEESPANKSAEPERQKPSASTGVPGSLNSAVHGIVERRSRWKSSLASLKYISSVAKDDGIKLRDSDRATAVFLLISCLACLMSLVIPLLDSQRLPLVLVCDLLVGFMLLTYVVNRFGIVTTLPPRQALLTWQLMLGAALLGIFIAINLAVLIEMVVIHTHIQGPL